MVVDGEGLLSLLRQRLQDQPFTLYMYMLTSGAWMKLLESVPPWVRERSEVFLDRSKAEGGVVEELASLGYAVWLAPDLHAKAVISRSVLAVGSANYTDRALRNAELNVVILDPYPSLVRAAEVLMRRVRLLAERVA